MPSAFADAGRLRMFPFADAGRFAKDFITKRISNISEAMKARSSRTITGFFKRIRVRKLRENLLLAIRKNIAGANSNKRMQKADISFDHLRIGSLSQETLIGSVDDRGNWHDGMLLKRLKSHWL